MEAATLSKRCCVRCTKEKLVCRVSEDSDRCLECVRRGVDCSLAPINVPKWKRLEERRKQLRRELSEAHAKSVCILSELDSIEADQEWMVRQELENIEVLEREEGIEATASKVPTEPPSGDPFESAVDWEEFAASVGFAPGTPAVS